MIINDLELFLVEAGGSGLEQPVRSVVFHLMTDADVEGWGEASLPWHAAEIPGRRDALLAALAGRSAFDIAELHTLRVLSNASLRSAVEMACWDVVGRAAGQPLCRLFGGGYRTRIPVAVRLPTRPADRVAEIARELAKQGLHSQILNVTGDARQDRQLLASVRESLGPRMQLRLDGQAAYEMDAARDLCADLERDGLQYFLDPLRTNELQIIAALGRQTSVPLAVGRTICSPADVLAVVRFRAAPYIAIDLGRIGGILPARDAVAIAETAGLATSLSAGASLGIATAAMLQLAAAIPAFSLGNECTHHQLFDDVLSERLDIADGMIAVPQAPGLGINVDRAKIDRYQVL